MNNLYKNINRWLPAKSDGDGSLNSYEKIIYIFSSINVSLIFQHFSTRVSLLDYKFTTSAITSGAMCFFGSLLMSFCQLGYVRNIEELFTFASCYILTDHYLDDNTIDIEDKINTIQQIDKFIGNVSGNVSGGISNQNNVSNHEITSPLINAVSDNYIKMVTNIPSSEQHLKKVFHAEVKTMYFQNHNNLDRDTYLHICEWKGGLFCNAIQAILELEVTKDEYDLGACIQLVDDMLDIDDDMSLDINTIVTHEYKENGNLDKLLIYGVEKINKINSKYNMFKIILLLGFTLAVHTNREKYSSEIIDIMDNFIYFKNTTNKETLMNWMIESI